ncbi:MAG: dipeptide epimerase [Fuerstiella sp.]
MPSIRSLDAYEVPVRLKQKVKHASHERDANQTLIVRCELSTGEVGWGEGLPREYVTGETNLSVQSQLQATDFSRWADQSIDSPTAAIAAIDQLRLGEAHCDTDLQQRGCFGNSVRCALELALLDAVTQHFGIPLGHVVREIPEGRDLQHYADVVRYSGVITSCAGWRQWRSAVKMKVYGFRQVKVKVGSSGIDDTVLLSRIRRGLGQKVDLRLDANEAWDASELQQRLQPLLRFGISSVEQPVPHAQVQDLAQLRSELDVPIMLDESLCSREDADRAISGGYCDLFNLRLSKCGGFVACVRLAALARTHGLGYQLGCQVGETGILSAAGRHFACNVGQIRYLEGSYDRFLVYDRLTDEDLTFGFGGHAPALTKPGLGVTLQDAKIRSLGTWQHPLIRS